MYILLYQVYRRCFSTHLRTNEWKTREALKCNKLHKWTHCISPQICSMFSISITSTTTSPLSYQINLRITPGLSNLSITSPGLAGYQVLTLYFKTLTGLHVSACSQCPRVPSHHPLPTRCYFNVTFEVLHYLSSYHQQPPLHSLYSPCIPNTWHNQPFPQLAGSFTCLFTMWGILSRFSLSGRQIYYTITKHHCLWPCRLCYFLLTLHVPSTLNTHLMSSSKSWLTHCCISNTWQHRADALKIFFLIEP